MQRYFPVNWQNGMKINQSHFIGLENSFRSDLIEYNNRLLNKNSYGILPVPVGTRSVDLYFKIDQSQQIVLNLTKCDCITPNGIYVRITPDQQSQNEFRIPLSEIENKLQNGDHLNVNLNIRPFERDPFGDPTQEDPPRAPYTKPKYFLTIDNFNSESIQRTNTERGLLTIGRIVVKSGSIELDEHYIPPSTCIAAHETLSETFLLWGKHLTEIFNNCLITIENSSKIIAANQETIIFDPVSKVSVAETINKLTVDILTYLSEILPPVNQLLRDQPPIHTLILMQQFAYRLKMNIVLLSTQEQSQLINYLKEAIKVNNFIKSLNDLIKVEYDHEDIGQTVKVINQFITCLKKMYDKAEGLPSRDFTWRIMSGEIQIKFHDEGPSSTLAN